MSVKLADISNSKKSLALNVGSGEEIGSGENAYLISKIYSAKYKRDIFLPVAHIVSVKTLANSSLWIVKKVYREKILIKGSRLVYLSQKRFLKGRKDITLTRNKVVSNPAQVTRHVIKDLEDDDSPSLSLKAKEQLVIAKTHLELDVYEADAELVDVSVWKTFFDSKQEKSIYKSQYVEEFRAAKNLSTFKKMIYAQLKKWNSNEYQTKRLYDDVNSPTIESYLTGIEREKNAKNARFQAFKSKMKNKRGWTSDYSDEELSYLVSEYGIESERKKIDKIINYKYDSQLITSFGINFLDNENLNDPDNTQVLKYDIQISGEMYSFKKIESLSNFTFELGFRRALDAMTTGSINATSTEYSISTNVNWYPFRDPSLVDVNIFYFSTYARFGYAELNSSSVNAKGSYQLYSFPGLLAGMKYNFTNLWGIRFTAAFENIVLDRIKKDDSDNLPNRLSYFDGKFSIGITRFI
jgi:hypothetical protein